MSDEIVGKVSGPRGTFRARLILDEDSLNPREQFDHTAHVVVVPNSRYISPDKDGGPFANHWQRFIRNTNNPVRAMELVVAIAGGRTLFTSDGNHASLLWYALPHEMRDGTGKDASAQQLDALLAAEAAEYRAWCEGDVWGIVIETEHYIPRTDEVEWAEHDGPVFGYYGYDDALAVAREQLNDLR